MYMFKIHSIVVAAKPILLLLCVLRIKCEEVGFYEGFVNIQEDLLDEDYDVSTVVYTTTSYTSDISTVNTTYNDKDDTIDSETEIRTSTQASAIQEEETLLTTEIDLETEKEEIIDNISNENNNDMLQKFNYTGNTDEDPDRIVGEATEADVYLRDDIENITSFSEAIITPNQQSSLKNDNLILNQEKDIRHSSLKEDPSSSPSESQSKDFSDTNLHSSSCTLESRSQTSVDESYDKIVKELCEASKFIVPQSLETDANELQNYTSQITALYNLRSEVPSLDLPTEDVSVQMLSQTQKLKTNLISVGKVVRETVQLDMGPNLNAIEKSSVQLPEKIFSSQDSTNNVIKVLSSMVGRLTAGYITQLIRDFRQDTIESFEEIEMIVKANKQNFRDIKYEINDLRFISSTHLEALKKKHSIFKGVADYISQLTNKMHSLSSVNFLLTDLIKDL